MLWTGFSVSPDGVAAQSGDAVTTVLQPGLNFAGWTEDATGVEAIFETIPGLAVAYAWDAENQRFRVALPSEAGLLGDLEELTPGMGLALLLAGDAPFTWTRPLVRSASIARLYAGWNLVVWTGEDGVAVGDALGDIDDIVELVADARGQALRTLTREQVFWVDLSSGGRDWDQLYEPPQIEFVSALSPQREQEVRDHIDDVVAFYFQRLGFRVPDVTVRYADPEMFGCSGNYRAPVINMADCLRIFAHEYVHAIQEYLTEGGRHPPLWFREGDADFWAALYNDATGERDYAQYVRELVLPIARRQGFVSTGYSYESYHIRVHVLVKREGPEGLSRFYRRVAALGDWQAAFEEVYGLTFDEFNVVFAQEMLRAPGTSDGCPISWFEPAKTRAPDSLEVCATIEGVVTDLSGNPRSGVNVGALLGVIHHEDGYRDASQVTGSEGEFSLSVPEGRYTVSLLPESVFQDLRRDFHYYHSQRGAVVTAALSELVSVTARDPAELVIAYGVLAGTIVSEDGRPVLGMHASVVDSRRNGQSGPAPGAFQFFVGSETYTIEFTCLGRTIGYYGGDTGFVHGRGDARRIVLEDVDITDLSVTVPDGVRCE